MTKLDAEQMIAAAGAVAMSANAPEGAAYWIRWARFVARMLLPNMVNRHGASPV